MRNKLPDHMHPGDWEQLACASIVRDLKSTLPASKSRVCVAFSGGLDSTVLLHLLVRARDCLATTRPIKLSAVHVHHGLSPNADMWSRHCRRICKGLGVPLRVRRVRIDRAPRTSLEEEARKARYAVLSSIQADWIALAHHADDQAESVLLQLFRGAGPKGLSGMATLHVVPSIGAGGLVLWRPLLDRNRNELLAYGIASGLAWVEDESNLDIRFKRNFVRSEVMPLIGRGFAALPITLARTARHMAEASELADELADLDLATAQLGRGLAVQSVTALSDARVKNLLRRWLANHGLRMPPEARLLALIRALRQTSNDTRLSWQHEGRMVRRKKGLLYLD